MGFPARDTRGLPGKRVAAYRAGMTAMAIKIFSREPIDEMGSVTWKSYHTVRTKPQFARYSAVNIFDSTSKVN
jgi:hypothetical protein